MTQVSTEHHGEQGVAVANTRLLGVAQSIEMIHGGRVQAAQDDLPALPRGLHRLARRVALGAQDGDGLGRVLIVALPARARRDPGKITAEIVEHRRHDGVLVADRLLDVHPLDAAAVVGEALQRDDHVLVDLEGVGVTRDGRGAGAVEPEALACLRTDRDETLPVARLGECHHLRGGLIDQRLVVAHEIRDQHHLGQLAPRGLGGVIHRPDIALVEML